MAKKKMSGMQSEFFRLDFSSCETLSAQLAGNIGRAIANGDLKAGDRLPSLAKMAEVCGTSLRVPREAVRQLENEGVLKGRPRSGLFVLARRRFVWRGSVLFVSYGRQSYYCRGVFFKGIAQRLAEDGWRVDFVNVVSGEGSAEQQTRPLRRALRNGHRLVFGTNFDLRTLSEIRKASVPYFTIGVSECACDDAAGFVSLSTAKAIVDMAERSVRAGVKRALCFAMHDDDLMFRIPFERKGIAVELQAVYPDVGIERFERNAQFVYRKALERLTDRRRPKIDLVYFADDSFATAGLWAVEKAGLDIPKDIKCATFSNRGNRPFFRLPLTCIEHDLFSHAEAIARRMIAFLNGTRPARRMTCVARFIRGKTL